MSVVLILACVLIGYAIILAEVILIPGTTIVGFLGAAAIFVGVYFAYDGYGATIGHLTLIGTVILGAIITYVIIKYRLWEFLSLKKNSDGKIDKDTAQLSISVGCFGVSKSALRPIGIIRVEGKDIEVESINGYIQENTKVVVEEVTEQGIFVREFKEA